MSSLRKTSCRILIPALLLASWPANVFAAVGEAFSRDVSAFLRAAPAQKSAVIGKLDGLLAKVPGIESESVQTQMLAARLQEHLASSDPAARAAASLALSGLAHPRVLTAVTEHLRASADAQAPSVAAALQNLAAGKIDARRIFDRAGLLRAEMSAPLETPVEGRAAAPEPARLAPASVSPVAPLDSAAAKPPAPPHDPQAVRKAIRAGMIGNVIEWYDFGVYGFMSPFIAAAIFPGKSEAAAQLATWGIFAAGFLMRPLGALIFGHIGDRLGRKIALNLSVALMVVPTAFIAFLPTYAQIGAAAPWILTIIRLMQGLSTGGEFTSSATYMVEHAAEGKRGLVASWTPFSVKAGTLLGALIGTIVTSVFTEKQMQDWAWRIPFLFVIVTGFVGWRLRSSMTESPLFEKAKAAASAAKKSFAASIAETLGSLKRNVKKVALAGGINIVGAGATYLLFVYTATYLKTVLHLPSKLALGLNTIGAGFLIMMIPFMGRLSDRIGRKPVLLFGAAGLALFSYPLFALMSHATVAAVVTAYAFFALFSAAVTGVMPVTMIEQFPTKDRATSLGLGYNITMALFGGLAPEIAQLLIGKTGNPSSPAFYMIALALISIAAMLRLRETARKPLD